MTKKVLIVDDDAVLRRTLASAFQRSGFTALMAPDAMSALTQARTHTPDLILLDLGLPAGGGFTVLDRLQQFPALSIIPVIVISGQDRAANEPRALAAGVVTYLEKPVTPEQVVEQALRILVGS